MRVAILGAGAGGAAAVAELSLAGHSVTLWGRSEETVQPFQVLGGVRYSGVLGSAIATPALITTDLSAAIRGADAVVVVLPALAHRAVARALSGIDGTNGVPVILNSGHPGGALEFREAYGKGCPPLAELSTLTYVARKPTGDTVSITGRAGAVRGAELPANSGALQTAIKLFPAVRSTRDILSTSLSDVNIILHPPGAILAAAWIEAKRGDFTFYVEGMTRGVARVMEELDMERRNVAKAYGHLLPSLVDEMRAIGTIDSKTGSDLATLIASGEANRAIKAPDSLKHRYYQEDFAFGLLPFLEFARIASVPCPLAESLLATAAILLDVDYTKTGRNAAAMGIAGLTQADLLKLVRDE